MENRKESTIVDVSVESGQDFASPRPDPNPSVAYATRLGS